MAATLIRNRARGPLRRILIANHEPYRLRSARFNRASGSPEQAAGAVDLIGRASDIYSLGATLYSLLTGLRNLHGNNSEWCHDWLAFDPGPEHIDPIGPPSGQCRVVRGGSYLSRPALARSASRGGLPPDFASPSAGLRLVRTLSTP